MTDAWVTRTRREGRGEGGEGGCGAGTVETARSAGSWGCYFSFQCKVPGMGAGDAVTLMNWFITTAFISCFVEWVTFGDRSDSSCWLLYFLNTCQGGSGGRSAAGWDNRGRPQISFSRSEASSCIYFELALLPTFSRC